MSVAHIGKQPVGALLRRQVERGAVAAGRQDQALDGRGGFLTVAADFRVAAHVQPQIPAVPERVSVGIRGVEAAAKHGARGQDRRSLGRAILRVEVNRSRAQAGAAVGRPAAAPEERHDIHRLGPAAVLEEHAVPGMGFLVVLRPVKHVGTQALGPALDGVLIGLAVEPGLLGARVLDRQLPRGAGHLPVAPRAKLGHPIGAGPALAPDVLRQGEHVGVSVEPDGIQVRAKLVQLVQHLLVLAADYRDHGMVGIDPVDHARDLVDLRPKHRPLLGGCVDLQLIAQRPGQQGGVALVLFHDGPQLLALPLHGGRIVVIEAPALLAERQVSEHAQAQRLRAIELRRTGADGVAAGRDELL